jgi:hypothetical protein
MGNPSSKTPTPPSSEWALLYADLFFFFFFFLILNKREGGGIRTKSLRFMRRDLQPIELPLGDCVYNNSMLPELKQSPFLSFLSIKKW